MIPATTRSDLTIPQELQATKIKCLVFASSIKWELLSISQQIIDEKRAVNKNKTTRHNKDKVGQCCIAAISLGSPPSTFRTQPSFSALSPQPSVLFCDIEISALDVASSSTREQRCFCQEPQGKLEDALSRTWDRWREILRFLKFRGHATELIKGRRKEAPLWRSWRVQVPKGKSGTLIRVLFPWKNYGRDLAYLHAAKLLGCSIANYYRKAKGTANWSQAATASELGVNTGNVMQLEMGATNG